MIPKPLRQVMDRYFAGCVAAIEEHGGAVEKFIGDAVLAAFGADGQPTRMTRSGRSARPPGR